MAISTVGLCTYTKVGQVMIIGNDQTLENIFRCSTIFLQR